MVSLLLLLLLLLLSFTKQFAVDAKRTFEVSDDDDVPNIFLSSLCADDESGQITPRQRLGQFLPFTKNDVKRSRFM
jgi:hypothetical protein